MRINGLPFSSLLAASFVRYPRLQTALPYLLSPSTIWRCNGTVGHMPANGMAETFARISKRDSVRVSVLMVVRICTVSFSFGWPTRDRYIRPHRATGSCLLLQVHSSIKPGTFRSPEGSNPGMKAAGQLRDAF